MAAKEKHVVLIAAAAVPYRALKMIPTKRVVLSSPMSFSWPMGIIAIPIRTSPMEIKFAKPTLLINVPIKGETMTTAIEYMLKTNPVQKPGMFFSLKTVGRNKLAKEYTLFVHTIIV